MRSTCPVCEAANPIRIDHRSDTPVLMNRLYHSAQAARSAARGTLDMVACANCGFAWNRAFDSALIVYDGDYENDQTHSAIFADHVAARAADIVRSVPAGQPVDYLEIGCGQGAFITDVARAAAGRLRSAVGFDPAWRGQDGSGPGISRIHKVYFSAETRHLLGHPPNVAASRHTIEHVPDPIAFLSAIRTALGPDSQARLFIETPCIDWILSREAMQDLFYEHCTIFTASSLQYALARAGFIDIEVGHVFGGQYLWASGRAGAATTQPSLPPARDLSQLAEAGPRFAARWTDSVRRARAAGPVAIWGAGAKGVTFALLTDPDARMLCCAIDINPAKQMLHLAGTGLQVLSPQAAQAHAPATIFVMNPNYCDEIRRDMQSVGLEAQIIPIN